MNRVRLFFAFSVLLFASGTAVAEQVPNLYEAEVPVPSQSADARQQALRAAFEVVLAKVTGYGAVASEPALKDALAAPDRYVLQFLFREKTAVPGQNGPALWARFDSAAVNALLRKHRLPVWGAVRPATLVWLAVDDRGQRRLVGANDTDALALGVSARADRRGLPVHLPLLDLQDVRRIQPADVWGDFQDVIQQASERYGAQAVLTGALLYDGNRYRARFTLYQDGRSQRWESSGKLEDVIAAGLDRASDEIAASYTQSAGGASALRVQVRGVHNLADYVRAMDYLDALSGVARVELLALGGDRVVYRLTLQGVAQGVEQAIRLGDTLAPDNEPELIPAQAELRYRLLK